MFPSAYFTNSSSPFASRSADRSFQTLRVVITTICYFVYPSDRGMSPSPLIISQRNNNVTSLAVIIIIVPPSSVLVHHERVFWHWTRFPPQNQHSKVHLPNHFPKLLGIITTHSVYVAFMAVLRSVVAIRVVVVTRQSWLTGVWFGQAKSGDQI